MAGFVLATTRYATARMGEIAMKHLSAAVLIVTLLTVAACGKNATERAATGGIGGAVIAGPVGAVAGATVGAATAR
jgi:hypothetical protein